MKVFVVLLLAGVAAAQFQHPFFSINNGRDSRRDFRRGSSGRRKSSSRDFNRGIGGFNNGNFNRGFGGGFRSDPQPGAKPSRGTVAHHSDGVYEYYYSWEDNVLELSGSEVGGYCRRLGQGWQPISIESSGKNNFVYGLIRGNRRVPYIWTGGRKQGGSLVWPNGNRFGFTDWSRTGGLGRPQPDSRDGAETCIAVLDNVYNDGLKWHDVKCTHRKPTVCERLIRKN